MQRTGPLDPRVAAAIRARLDAALSPDLATLLPLRVDGQVAGRMSPARAARLCAFGEVFRRDGDGLAFVDALDSARLRDPAIARVARTLAEEGALTAWRDEIYAAAPAFGAPAWFHVERAAARYLGIHTWAVHANGLVPGGEGDGKVGMWIARRSARKAIDPGMLDNLVGGGLPDGESPGEALKREAWEEAGLRELRIGAPVAELRLARIVPDGFQLETIFAYDLWLARGEHPANQDGEVAGHRLVDLGEAARLMAATEGPDAMTLDATLVAFDCLLRLGG